VKTLMRQLDPRTTRVGVVWFAGDLDPLTADAYTQVPLTSSYGKVTHGLDDLLDMGPSGRTNMMSGVNQATIELAGTQSAYSERRPGAKRIMVFLTDGTPTLPLENSYRQNARMAIAAAQKAARLGIRIDTYAIGREALDEPMVTVEMAHVTDGTFTPVRDPRNLKAVFENVSFASVAELEVKNSTTGEDSEYEIQNADGSFSALVPVIEGMNVLEVYAKSTEGTEERQTVRVRYVPGSGASDLNPRLLAQRNRLMENRLLDLQQRSIEIEAERDDRVRRELMVEIERERSKALQRSDARRRELAIDVDK